MLVITSEIINVIQTKVTTFVVIFANAFSVFNQNNDVTFFRRRIDNQTIRNACTILVIYLVLFLVLILFQH